MVEETTPNCVAIRKELAERFATGVDRVAVEDVARTLNVANSEVRKVVGDSYFGELVLDNGRMYVTTKWMRHSSLFKRCVRCGHEICDRNERKPIHCIKCGIETGSARPKFASKWKHHLNMKKLRELATMYGTHPFTRKQLIELYEQMWGYNLSVDDFMYYYIRAGLVARIRPGEYILTVKGFRATKGLTTRKQIIDEQVEREFQEMKRTIESGQWYYPSGMTR